MRELPVTTEAVVVGAGPVGLATAVGLAEAGVHAAVLDAQAEGTNTSRAAVVHARTLEILDRWGLAAPLVERGVKVTRFTVRDRDRVLTRLRFDRLPTAFPFLLMTPQSTTEAVLTDGLRSRGGEVHRPVRVTSVKQDDDRVLVATEGSESPIETGYVVGADGVHSVVREQAGIGFSGSEYDESFVLADVQLDWALPADEVMFFLAPKGLVVVAPLPGGRHRIVATVEEAPEHPSETDVQELFDTRGPHGGATVSDLAWSSRFRIAHRVADRYHNGRLALAGDAAHAHSPAGGQGMNTGIQDAAVLADAVAAAVRGSGTAFAEYERGRRRVAEDVVALTDRMTRMATLPPGPKRVLRNAVLPVLTRIPPVQRRLAMTFSELIYR